MSSTKKKHNVPQWVEFLSGGFGGMTAAIVTCPLELVKTRMQSSQYKFIKYTPTPGTSLVNQTLLRSYTYRALYTTVQKDGFFSLWQGLGPILVGVVPARAIYFTTYHQVKRLLVESTGKENSAIHLFAAATASFSTSTLTCPIWMVKTRVQLEKHTSKATAYQPGLTRRVIADIWREDGFRGFYRGLSASYLGIVETALQFMIYEKLKKYLNSRSMDKQSTIQVATQSFISAAFAKLSACALTYPHEVVRTRMREESGPVEARKYQTLAQTFRTIVAEEGAKGLYKGMNAHMIRVVPNAATLFLTFELGVHLYEKFRITTEE